MVKFLSYKDFFAKFDSFKFNLVLLVQKNEVSKAFITSFRKAIEDFVIRKDRDLKNQFESTNSVYTSQTTSDDYTRAIDSFNALKSSLQKQVFLFEILDFTVETDKMRKLVEEVDNLLLKIIDLFCSKIYNRFAMDLTQKDELHYLRLQFIAGKTIGTNCYNITYSFENEINKVEKTLISLGDKIPTNSRKLYNLISDIGKGKKLFERLKKCIEDYNNLQQELDPIVYEEICFIDQYTNFVSNLKSKLYAKNELRFEDLAEMDTFISNTEAILKSIQEISVEMTKEMKLAQKILDLCLMKNFFVFPGHWKNPLGQIAKMTYPKIREFFFSKIYESLSEHILAFIKNSNEKNKQVSLNYGVENFTLKLVDDSDELFAKAWQLQINGVALVDSDLEFLGPKRQSQLRQIYLTYMTTQKDAFKLKIEQVNNTVCVNSFFLNDILVDMANYDNNIEVQKNQIQTLQKNSSKQQIVLLIELLSGIDSTNLKKQLYKLKENLEKLKRNSTNISIDNINVCFQIAFKWLKELMYQNIDSIVNLLEKRIENMWYKAISFAKSTKKILYQLSPDEDESLNIYSEEIMKYSQLEDKLVSFDIGIKVVIEDEEFLLINVENYERVDEQRERTWIDFKNIFEEKKIIIDSHKEDISKKIENDYKMIAYLVQDIIDDQKQAKQFLKTQGDNSKEFLKGIEKAFRTWKDFTTNNGALIASIKLFPSLFTSYISDFESIDSFFEVDIGDWKICIEMTKEIDSFFKEKWMKSRYDIGQLRSSMDKYHGLGNLRDSVVSALQSKMKELDIWIEFLGMITGFDFDTRNWQELLNKLEIKKDMSETTGWDFINNKYFLFSRETLETLRTKALNEKLILRSLDEISFFLKTTDFEFKDLSRTNKDMNVNIICNFDNVIEELNEKATILHSLKASPFCEPFLERITSLEDQLRNLETILADLKTLQSKWMQLLPVLSGSLLKQIRKGDITKFFTYNTQFSAHLKFIYDRKGLMSLLQINDLKTSLTKIMENFESVQKGLVEHLEKKRYDFARFYFLGDNDLILLLGDQRPETLNKIVKNLFPGVKRFIFDETEKNITGVFSDLDEPFELVNELPITSDCVKLFQDLDKALILSLRKSLESFLSSFSFLIKKFPNTFEQECILSNWIHFYENFKKEKTAKEMEEIVQQNIKFLLSQNFPDMARTNLKDSLLLNCITQNDIITKFRELEGQNTFHYFSLLKYEYFPKNKDYMNPKNELLSVKIGHLSTNYSFEYLGNQPRLVYTPLTEKCFLAFAEAMVLGLGGNPYGPAGTGKTETVKSLGGMLGRLVIVFNCEENMEFKNISRLFIGIAGCGAWGCFDEFNRLAMKELSAISQIITEIQSHLKFSKVGSSFEAKECFLLSKPVKLSLNTGIFVTLNPAGKGYRGRNRLPENLKILFRCFAMTRPNIEIIAKVTFVCAGYEIQFSESAAKKVVVLFECAQRILGNDISYDWGLRALKTTILQAASFKRAFRQSMSLPNINLLNEKINSKTIKEISKSDPKNQSFEMECLDSFPMNDELRVSLEFISLRTAIESNIIPKLKEKDKDIFRKIFESVFKDMQNKVDTGNQQINFSLNETTFKKECVSTYHSQHLMPLDSQIDNLYKIKVLLEQRVGFGIVGPSGTGKSTMLSMLKIIMSKFNKKVQLYKIYPKAIDRHHLFGFYDESGLEYCEGVFIKVLRNAMIDLSEGGYTNVWIVFDGDIDPLWVENLNSALDDNRLFTLPTGERFLFPSGLNIIFETVKLKSVSMATVSRIGLLNNSMNLSEMSKINEFLFETNQSGKIEVLTELKEYLRLVDRYSLNKNFAIENFNERKHTIYVRAKGFEQLDYQNNCTYYFCNKMTSIKDFTSFLNQISRKGAESHLSGSNGLFHCIVNDFDLIQEDEFGTVALDQLLLQLIDDETYYYEGNIQALVNIKIQIRVTSKAGFSKISKRLRNRFYIEAISDIEIKTKDHDKNSHAKNTTGLKGLSAFVLTKDIDDEGSKGIDGTKLKFLAAHNIKETSSKYLTFTTKLPKSFFTKGRLEFETKFRPLNEKYIDLWNACDVFKRRFEKLYIALTLKNMGDIVFASEEMTDRKICIEFTANFLGIEIYRVANTNFIARDICNIVQELVNGKSIILLIEEHQLENELFMSKIDSLSNFDNFTPFVEEIRACFGQKDSDFMTKLINAKKKFKIMIVWSKSSTKKFEELLNGFSSFQRRFTVVMDENWTRKDTDQYVSATYHFENLDVQANIVETLEQSGMRSKIKPLMRIFDLLMEKKRLDISYQTEKYKKGTSSFSRAQEEIRKLKLKVEEEKKLLKENQVILDKKVEEITRSTFEVNDKRAIAMSLEQELKDEQVNLKVKKRQIEEELSKVMPLVEDAKQQIKSLSKNNIDELRNYKIPPESVIDIFTALLKLMNEFDTSWSNMKKVLGKRTIIEQITEIDPRSIKITFIYEIEQLVAKKKDSFDKEKVIKVSVAAAPIAEFVKAILKFVKTVQNIKPLEDEFTILDQKLQGSLTRLKDTEKKLDVLVQRQGVLQESLKLTSMETEELKIKIKDKENFLDRAQQLLSNLNLENQRWQNTLASFDEKKIKLEFFCFAASYYFTFLTSEESKIAKIMIAKISKGLNDIADFSCKEFIADTKDRMNWVTDGHPDSEHGLINTGFYKLISWPCIIIDPEEKILKFIEKKNTNIEILDQSDPKAIFKLELAIKFGKTLLLTNCNFPLPEYVAEVHIGRTVLIEKNAFLKLNDKMMQKHPNFTINLFCKTREIDPKFKQKFQVFNYSSSVESVQEDILSRLVDWMNPDIEISKKNKLLEKQNLEREMLALEEQILNILSESDSNFVENEILFVTLNETRTKVDQASKNIEELEKFLSIMAGHRDVFKPVSIKISLIFDLIFSLTRLSGMYFYSIGALFDRLSKFMAEFETDFVPDIFLKKFTEKICREMSAGLSNCHYLAFLVQLTYILGLFDSPSEPQRFFSNVLNNDKPKKAFFEVLFLEVIKSNKRQLKLQIKNKMIPESLGYILQKLQPIYPNTINNLINAQSKSQIEALISGQSDLEQLFLSRFFFAEKLPFHIIQYLNTKFEKETITKEINLENLLKDSLLRRTLIFFTGHKDPSAEIQSFCTKINLELNAISFGRLQVHELSDIFRSFSQKPVCLYLKDLHLNAMCANTITDILKSLKEKTHAEFRLVISSEPLENLPQTMLENFERVFLESESSIILSFNHAEELLKNKTHENRILTNLAMFHAIVLERLNYLPFGWTKDYQFNSFDLFCALQILKLMSSNNSDKMMADTICNVVYLAKIEDPNDRLILKFIYEKIFNPSFDVVNCINENNDEKLLNILLGLEYSALIVSKTQFSDSIRSSIQILNSAMTSVENQEGISSENNEVLRKVVDVYAQCEENLTLKIAKDIGNDVLDYFISSEITNYDKLVESLQIIIDSIKKYLNGKIKLFEVHHYADLIGMETPQSLQDLWEYTFTINDYIKKIPILRVSLQNNLTSLKSKSFIFESSGFLDHRKFFEVMKLHYANLKKEVNVNIHNLQFKVGSAATPQFRMNSLYLQGADLDRDNRLIRLKDSEKYNPFKDIESIPIEIFNMPSHEAVEGLIEVPLYLNSSRTTKLLNLWVPVDLDLYKNFVIASVGFFIHNF